MLRLSCVVQGPICGRFMGFYVNGFLSIKRISVFNANVHPKIPSENSIRTDLSADLKEVINLGFK